MLSFASDVYVYFPGGYGTLDEFFELITLVQNGKVNQIPIILYGKEFWTPLVRWLEDDLMRKYKTISPEDLELYTLVDSVEEAYETIVKKVDAYCGRDGLC
jgi:hypothetical protein